MFTSNKPKKNKLPLILLLLVLILGGGYAVFNYLSDKQASQAQGSNSGQISNATTVTQPLANTNNTQTGTTVAMANDGLKVTSSIVPTTPQTPTVQSFSNVAVPTVDSSAWMVLDVDSGQIIAQHNADEKLAPASLTKLLTASLTFTALDNQQLNLDQQVVVSERAWKTGGSRTFIKVDTQVAISDLLQGMIVQSGNDATIQLAEVVGGSVEAFVEKMNKEAKAFGMVNSSFADPTGLPSPQTYTTVRDLSLLAQHIIKDHPKYFHYFSQQEFTYNKIRQPNRNGLLSKNIGVDGLKTGHTDDAGYCLISTALRDGRRVLTIVMGTKSMRERERISQQLLDWAYMNFANHVVAPAGLPVVSPRVYEGKEKTVNLGAKQGVAVTLPRGQEQNVQMLTQLSRELVAPIKKGDTVGTVQFILNGKVLKQDTLVALNDVEQAGFFGRMWDKLVKMF
ncbi:cytochrome C550 [Pelistega indica]|uniref:serine-type D-Ala-D-Ala carboxypeptidase n=1 Tax=Pelistega indica TaxID=1414851 RepID=V8G2W4_9BURK|nr:D-alanyl-D-alanine carboxypeptidase family protein [Pelistega indica]ETD70780.1 cytochrome C550 [Pelistega indica]